MAAKAERVRISASVSAEIASKLRSEADARVLNEAVLIEKALEMYLPTLPPLPGTARNPMDGERT